MASGASATNLAASPIVVYQMGKVGSLSIRASLEDLQPGVPIYHSHALYNLEMLHESMREVVRFDANSPNGTLDGIRASEGILDEFRRHPRDGEPWNFISIFREPIARNLSSFFQSGGESIKDFNQRLADGSLTIEEAAEHFVTNLTLQQTPLVWFDHQVRTFLHVDVYRHPFPHEKGYQILEGYKSRLLILKFEDMHRVASEAIEKFLGIGGLVLKQVNRSQDKPYAQFYSEFLKRFAFPKAYVDALLGSRYCSHFYTPDEIEGFYRKYLPSPGNTDERRVWVEYPRRKLNLVELSFTAKFPHQSGKPLARKSVDRKTKLFYGLL